MLLIYGAMLEGFLVFSAYQVAEKAMESNDPYDLFYSSDFVLMINC